MKQSEKLTQLLELMQANPELPVIPCVDGDVVSGDEYYCWLGSWGESAVQEFVIGRERTYYREDGISEMNDVLCEHYDPELVDNMTEEETRAAYNALTKPLCKEHLDGINKLLDTKFTPEDMEYIYTNLGNGINHELCMKFVKSGYDLKVIEESV